jgi:hypothetical protein
MVAKIRRLKKQVEGLENFMDEKGYHTIDEMLGIASDAFDAQGCQDIGRPGRI